MRISLSKRDKISEQILLFLYQKNSQPQFTSYIAKEVARDEEFIKGLLNDLREKRLVLEIKKNKEGLDYLRRSRWRLSPGAYEVYRKKQN